MDYLIPEIDAEGVTTRVRFVSREAALDEAVQGVKSVGEVMFDDAELREIISPELDKFYEEFEGRMVWKGMAEDIRVRRAVETFLRNTKAETRITVISLDPAKGVVAETI